MKFYLQRDTSDIFARFRVLDESGSPVYTVVGKHSPTGESLRINTQNGDTVCKIRSLGFSALTVFSISSGKESMRLNVAVGSGRISVRFRGISFILRGDALSGSYSIVDADTSVVCTVGRDFSKGCTQLVINQEDRQLFCLAVAACIDSLSVDRTPILQMS